jgi:dipeptidyl aminopeptidase/acylaminoacyl peptidase
MAGYNVFAPNYRGSSGFGAEFQNLNLGDVGGGDLQDVLYGARYAADLLGSAGRPAIMGASYGGYLTLMALTTQPDEWSGGVAFVPVADWREDYRRADAHFRRYCTHFLGGAPDQRPDLYADRSPITHVGRLRSPLLILHGENDPRCPIESVRALTVQAQALGLPVRLVSAAGEGHGAVELDQAASEVALALDHLDNLFGYA